MTEYVRFYCPKCGELAYSELAQGFIYAEPDKSIPEIKCGNRDCGANWRVELYEVEERTND